MWESVIVLFFVIRFFMSILFFFCNNFDWEERAGFVAWFVLLVSHIVVWLFLEVPWV